MRRAPVAAVSAAFGAVLLAGCVGLPDDRPPAPAPATAEGTDRFAPGAVGIGDPYFPLDGNGGYDVGRYDLELSWEPASGELSGTATISATATQGLSAFDLDFDDLGLVVHEYAHQWFGDSVTIERWSDLWLNESFATYAEWLWAEHTGGPTPAMQADALAARPADDPLWAVTVADPGAADLFDDAVYLRGAMTLQALRDRVGDDTFFAIARGWASGNAGGTVGTDDFVTQAEEVSGENLDDLFEEWISIPEKPRP